MHPLSIIAVIALAGIACTDEVPPRNDANAANPAIPAPAKAATDPLTDVENYRLTIDDLRKYVRSAKNLEQVGRAHPELESATHVNVNEFDTLEERIATNPHLLKAVTDAGLTTRHYLLLSWVVLNTSFGSLASDAEAEAMLKQARVHPDNLVFFKQHKSELEALSPRK